MRANICSYATETLCVISDDVKQIYWLPRLTAQTLINIYIILAQGGMMSIFWRFDLKNIEMNLQPLMCQAAKKKLSQ